MKVPEDEDGFTVSDEDLLEIFSADKGSEMSKLEWLASFIFFGTLAAILIGAVVYVVVHNNHYDAECLARGGHLKSIGITATCVSPDGRFLEW